MSVSVGDSVWCDVPWTNLYITVSGEVRPCCDCECPVGSVVETDILTLWGPGTDPIREAQNRGVSPPGCRGCCSSRIGRVKKQMEGPPTRPRLVGSFSAAASEA